LRKAERKFPRALETNLRLAGEFVIGASKKQFKGMRTSALYKIRGGRRVARTPPLPVTAPRHMLAVFEGQYRKSITQDVQRKGSKRWLTEIGPEVPYARVHELGKRGMPKRQVLTPGVKQSEKDVFKILGRTFKVI
jgi:hypothetical protein